MSVTKIIKFANRHFILKEPCEECNHKMSNHQKYMIENERGLKAKCSNKNCKCDGYLKFNSNKQDDSNNNNTLENTTELPLDKIKQIKDMIESGTNIEYISEYLQINIVTVKYYLDTNFKNYTKAQRRINFKNYTNEQRKINIKI